MTTLYRPAANLIAEDMKPMTVYVHAPKVTDFELADVLQKRVDRIRQHNADGEALLGENYRRILDELSNILAEFKSF